MLMTGCLQKGGVYSGRSEALTVRSSATSRQTQLEEFQVGDGDGDGMVENPAFS